jgi:hypothetical protein
MDASYGMGRAAGQTPAAKLVSIAEYLGEKDFVLAAKPDMAKKELQGWIMLFRAAVREERGL